MRLSILWSRAELDAEIEDVADLLVDHDFRQPELGNLRAHHAAGAIVAVEHDAVVAERREIARDGERRRSGADERDALAVLLRRGSRQPGADVFLVVGGDALQPADRDRLRLDLLGISALLDATATAGGLAGTVAGAAENAGKDVGFPVDEVGVAEAARRDQSDVFGNGGMGRTRPLTVDDFVEIVGVRDIRRLQTFVSKCSLRQFCRDATPRPLRRKGVRASGRISRQKSWFSCHGIRRRTWR